MSLLNDTEIQVLLSSLTPQQKVEFLENLEEQTRRLSIKKAQSSITAFARHVYPGFKEGAHHRKLANIFKDVIEGKKKRVIVNIAPRMGKSEFASYLFPAWFLGQYPDKKIIMATHTAGLSEDFGRRVRNLLDAEEYREIFPNTLIADDQKAAGKWSTSAGGPTA